MGHQQNNQLGAGCCVLTGKVRGGKTTLVESVVAGLQEKDLRVAGVISRGIDQEGKRLGYLLVNIESLQKCILASVNPRSDWFQFRRFYFNPAAIDQGRSWLKQGLREGADLLVIDEVGPLELQGGGWFPVLEEIAKIESPMCQLWVVREQSLTEVRERWLPGDVHILHLHQSTSPGIIAHLLDNIERHV